MYTTKFLRTDSYETFYEECAKIDLVSDNRIKDSDHNYCLILIGDLYRDTGKMIKDADGNEYPEQEILEGYHVNLRYKEPIGLEHLEITVKTPLRLFAGES